MFQHPNILKVKGLIHLVLTDETGKVIDERYTNNLVVTTGITHITERLDRTLPDSPMSEIGVGSDATTPAAGDTALLSELGTRASMLAPYPQATGTNQVVYQGVFAPGNPPGSPSLAEAGIFNNTVGGTMLARGVFGALTKNPGDTLTITWTLQFAAV